MKFLKRNILITSLNALIKKYPSNTQAKLKGITYQGGQECYVCITQITLDLPCNTYAVLKRLAVDSAKQKSI